MYTSIRALFNRTVVSIAIASAVIVTPLQAEETKTLVFSAIPDQDESALKARFGIVADYLSKTLEVPVKYVPVKSYAAAVTSFRNDQVQLAWFGGLSGVKARLLVPGAQAIAQGEEDPNFHSYIIAHHSTGLKVSEDFPKGIEGKTFTFGSKGSTSGRLMPEFNIRENMGKGPEEIFKTVGFSGNHSRTVTLVESGAYEVGAVNFKVWDKMVEEKKVDTSKVSAIWKTPAYPDYQWTIRGDVDAKWGEGFTEKVKQALLAMDDPKLLASFPRKSFIAATNEDFAPILNTAKELGLVD
ncbi:putative selenate ABC transporter substrate-binding protein [Leucothrix arctica]|uniref:Putative selenate ABC transporter substrate-binding protein n=1 Tax=Leucothrix arctica TaxID=1481894 RepID=A0A317CHB6_9GAMM|nr:putative selenate ABC transporter substrate-binding protein [Leucothrix arctica]PWQ97946.1 putative selenate ABC transporter substrate-binding protein [Leucothrix arctica]